MLADSAVTRQTPLCSVRLTLLDNTELTQHLDILTNAREATQILSKILLSEKQAEEVHDTHHQSCTGLNKVTLS